MREFADFKGYTLEFLKEKALWIKELKSVFLADLHLGKANHFRKAGIPIPEPIHDADFINLRQLLDRLKPQNTYFLGDLFHSSWNGQWEVLNSFLIEFPQTQFHLIKGNHDILPTAVYGQSVLKIHEEPLTLTPFIFSHEPLQSGDPSLLNICGHIHPGVLLRGKARQSVKAPCFHWSEGRLILPSFGNFTGLALIQPEEKGRIWIVSAEKVIPILSD